MYIYVYIRVSQRRWLAATLLVKEQVTSEEPTASWRPEEGYTQAAWVAQKDVEYWARIDRLQVTVTATEVMQVARQVSKVR